MFLLTLLLQKLSLLLRAHPLESRIPQFLLLSIDIQLALLRLLVLIDPLEFTNFFLACRFNAAGNLGPEVGGGD